MRHVSTLTMFGLPMFVLYAQILSLLHDKYTRLVNPSTYESLSKYDMVGAGVMLSPNQV
jgi:hypothetical protein